MDEFLAEIESIPGRLEELRAPSKGRRGDERGEEPVVVDLAAEDGPEGGGEKPPGGTRSEAGGEGGDGEVIEEGQERDPQAVDDPSRPFSCADGCR